MAAARLDVDLGVNAGVIRPLHGVNMGPIQYNGCMDTSACFRELGFPYTRLHDCPYAVPETVDVHSIFPIFDADPQDPGNYRFAMTDDYIQAILDAGSQIIYRLGESIEHYTRRKYFVHPPKDFHKWSEICVNIIRHYNEGWANGFRHNIRYWEIWNEAIGNPPCWTGTTEEYYRLYEIAAKAIKAHDSTLMVGGPSAHLGKPEAGFLEHCRKTCAPLDFYSWHIYARDLPSIVKLASQHREALDQAGFTHTETHLNEWNYKPAEDFGFRDPVSLRRHFEKVSSEEGAAFDAATLIHLQDCPVNLANYYWAMNGLYGFLDYYGAPRKNYYAFRAFRSLLDTPQRALTFPKNDPDAGYALLAGTADASRAGILLANVTASEPVFALSIKGWSWPGKALCKCYLLDSVHDLELVKEYTLDPQNNTIQLSLPAPAFCLLAMTPGGNERKI